MSRIVRASTLLSLLVLPAAAAGQDAPAAQLARGWSSLAAGRAQEAATVAGQILDTAPRSHDAASLAVTAHASDSQPMLALDAYERWLGATMHEDIFLLQPVATSVLRELSSADDPSVRFAALGALAAAGDRNARAALHEATSKAGSPVDADVALMNAGDTAAIERVQARVAVNGRDTAAAIGALRDARATGATDAIAAALKDPAPPTRIAAANALAELGATAAIPALKDAIDDPDPVVRNMVRLALARLGDPSGGNAVQELGTSPVGELRLLGVEIEAERNPRGPWADKAEALLQDEDVTVRIKAAGLLLEKTPNLPTAIAALTRELASTNPATRSLAARSLRTLGLHRKFEDLGPVRRLLRDRLPEIRVEAAMALIVR